MKHAEFRKRVEALVLCLNQLHDDMMGSPLEPDDDAGLLAGFLLEVGQFEAARLVLEDIACHPDPETKTEPSESPSRIVLP